MKKSCFLVLTFLFTFYSNVIGYDQDYGYSSNTNYTSTDYSFNDYSSNRYNKINYTKPDIFGTTPRTNFFRSPIYSTHRLVLQKNGTEDEFYKNKLAYNMDTSDYIGFKIQ